MNGLQEEIDALRRRCIGCGKCSKVCPSLKHGGCDPMEVMVGNDEDVLECITCGNCSRVCRRSDPFRVMQDLIFLAKNASVSEAFRKTGYAMPLPESGPVPRPEWTGDDAYVMPGCIVKCKAPHVEHAAAACMKAIGVACRELPGSGCCMHPVQFRGMTEFERRGRKLSMNEAAGGKDLIALCAGCRDELASSGVDAVHIIDYLAERLDALPRFEGGPRVAVEPGCSAAGSESAMRKVVEAMGCEIVNSRTGCCGKYSPVSESLMKERQEECAGADVIVVGCPMCLVRFEDCEGGLPTVHIAELVAMAAGDTESLKYHKIRPSDGSWDRNRRNHYIGP